jgi:hypothetical protein
LGCVSPGPSRRARFTFEEIVGILNAVVALGLAFHLIRELVSAREMGTTDFAVFRTGWSLILDGRARELYEVGAQQAMQSRIMGEVGSAGFQEGMMAFLHPPHAALAGCALGWVAQRFGAPVAFWIWTGVSIALLVHLVRLVSRELRLDARESALAGATLAAFYPVLETLQQGQVSALLAVAALACVRAVREGRAGRAAAWLLVLSIKPQTLPALLVVLAVRKQWRVIGLAAALGGLAALVTGAALGGQVWWSYLTHVHGLERYFGVGTPDHMPTVRGFLTRLLGAGPEHQALIDAASVVAWLAAISAGAVAAWRTRAHADPRAPLAFALAVGCLASPHLFPQDVLLWVTPVTLLLSLARDGGARQWRLRSRVVLAWPLWFVLARALDIRETAHPRLPVDLMLLPLMVATLWALREVRRAGAVAEAAA